MPPTDRLAELRRRRAQFQDHLEWLDREIAAEEQKAPSPAAPAAPIGGANATQPVGAPAAPAGATPAVSGVPTPAAVSGAPVAAPANSPRGTAASIAAADAAQDAEAVLDEYRVPAASLQKDVRNGCLLYFAAAVLILAILVVGLYYALRR